MRNLSTEALTIEVQRRLICERNGICYACDAPLDTDSCEVSHKTQGNGPTSIRIPHILALALEQYAEQRGLKKSQAIVSLLYNALIKS